MNYITELPSLLSFNGGPVEILSHMPSCFLLVHQCNIITNGFTGLEYHKLYTKMTSLSVIQLD